MTSIMGVLVVMKVLTTHLNQLAKSKWWLPAFGVFEREVRRFFAVPAQTLFGPLCSALIYFGLFGLSLGKVLDKSPASISAGIAYVVFLIPGIMAMESVNASIQNPMSSIMIAKWSGTIIDILMAPITPFALWMAYICGAFIRVMIVATAVLTAGIICSQQLPSINLIFLLFSSFVCVGIFGSFGIVLGIICKTWDQVGMILSFIIQPLVFFSGVFFSFDFLPPWLQFAKYLNPIFYIVSLFRYSVLQKSDINILVASAVSIIFLCIMFSLANLAIRHKLGVRA